jgi:hypothetical protein
MLANEGVKIREGLHTEWLGRELHGFLERRRET